MNMSILHTFSQQPANPHARRGFWSMFDSKGRRQLLEEDLEAGKTVSLILGSIVIGGVLLMIVTVILAI